MDLSLIIQVCLLVGFVGSRVRGDGFCHVFIRRGKVIADCSDRNLSRVPQHLPPNISQLILNHNNIRNVSGLMRYTSLDILDVSDNHLEQLHKDDFLGLHNLTHLDIHGNHLQLTNTSYPVGLFRHQKKLISLKMNTNSATEGNDLSYQDKTLSDLIALEELFIDGIKDEKFGEGFGSLVQLTTLFIGGNCDIRKLRNDTLKFLSRLQVLSLRSCMITDIEMNTFSPLKRIHTLDISHNEYLGLYKVGRSFYGLINSTIKIIKANNINRGNGIGILVRAKDMIFIKDTNLEELYVDGNRLQLVEVTAMRELPATLKRFSARDNVFNFGIYLLSASTMSNLEWIDVSGQDRSHVQPFNVPEIEPEEHHIPCSDDEYQRPLGTYQNLKHNFHDPWPGNVTLSAPPNVTFVNVSFSKLTFDITGLNFGPNSLIKLDMSYNYFTKWYGPVVGLNKLEIVDLSNNLCDYVSDVMTYSFPALRILNISSNYLGYSLTNNTLRKLPNLEELNLSNNKINSLPSHMLLSCRQIKYLDFSLNYMNDWTLNIDHMMNLTLLNLSSNLLEMLPLKLMHQADSIYNPDLRIDITGNPLKCTCTALDSLKWMEKNTERMAQFHSLSCMYNERKHSFTNLKEIILELDRLCASYVGVMIGVLALVLLVLAVGVTGVVYRYRWKLRYMYYVALNKYRGYIPQQQEEQHFEFDAFVSYADEDRSFVTRDMRLVLEEPEGQGEQFRLCIHHRDFLAGEAIAANILKAISSSRKTVAILTRNFLRSYWCRYEVEMAKMESIHTGRNTLVIIVMEDIPVKDLPADIVEVMGRDCYVEFTNDAEGSEVFWRNLKRAIAN